MNGEGTMTYPDGEKEEGKWRNDLYEGEDKPVVLSMTKEYPNGDTYKG
jgi:hypothetical protein